MKRDEFGLMLSLLVLSEEKSDVKMVCIQPITLKSYINSPLFSTNQVILPAGFRAVNVVDFSM